jgi:hypothetical protein
LKMPVSCPPTADSSSRLVRAMSPLPAVRLAAELALGLSEPAQHRAVDNLVVNTYRNPAQHGGIDDDLKHDLGAKGARDSDPQPVGLLFINCASNRNDSDGPLTSLRREIRKRLDLTADASSAGTGHDALDEPHGGWPNTISEQPLQQSGLALDRKATVRERQRQARSAVDKPSKAEELVFHLIQTTGRLLSGKQSLGAQTLDSGQQIRRTRPTGADNSTQQLERKLLELTAQQTLKQIATRLLRNARISECATQRHLSSEQISHAEQLVRSVTEGRTLSTQPGDGAGDDTGNGVGCRAGACQLIEPGAN